MHRRNFVRGMAAALVLPAMGCTPGSRLASASALPNVRRLKRVGLQLYSLRDAARVNLERTLADIAAAGYRDVELLSSMSNFGFAPARLRELLDRNGLRAPSTHVGGPALDDIERELDDAQVLGHRYIVLASLPIRGAATLDDYRRWADRLNDAGRRARSRGMWIAFHDEPDDFRRIDGVVPYDVLVEHTDPALVRLQLDTGNALMGGADPLAYLKRHSDRYFLFHIKDAPAVGASTDAELGKGVVDFRALFEAIPDIDDKLLYVEQETYPGAPIDSIRRDYAYISKLTF